MVVEASPNSIEPQRRSPRSAERRERKRTKTRLAIQAEALRLFAEKGYSETTVEEIADAAAISPRTFFRYFPTKEDVVIWDEYDPRMAELIESRPDDEPPAESFRAIIREAVQGLYSRNPEELRTRHRLLNSVPELRARFLEQQDTGVELLAAAFAQRRKVPDDLRLRVTAAALGAAVTVAFNRWQEDEGKSDLIALLDQTIADLAEGIGELQPRPRVKRA